MREPTMHVSAKGDKTWKVRFRLAGRQSSETFRRQADARRFSKWLGTYGVEESLRLLAESRGASAGDHTVASWCTEHVDSLTGVTSGTTSRYRSYIANDLGALGELPLTAVEPGAVGRWVRELETAGASGKTIKNKHGFVSAAMTAAVKRGLIPSNPCRGTRLPRTVVEPMVFLTHDEYTRFLGCFTSTWRPFVEVLFATGLRWGEITALHVGDVDLEHGTITVTRAWKEADEGRVLGPPKSKRSQRTIALAPETVEVLAPFVGRRPADAFLFVNARDEPVKPQTFHDNVWQPAVRLANGEPGQRSGPKAKRVARRLDDHGKPIEPLDPPLGKRPRVHDARHTCASWLLGAGIPINYVQAHLGHESITTTVDRYGHVMPAARAAVSAALSQALTASRPTILPDEPAQLEA
ncbi:tyrosine-type recombinase/integrase [Luteimicrobium subarcticum]|nr:tyrosine-type recombinase/integrase [Luteimicrobium subarcticum]